MLRLRAIACHAAHAGVATGADNRAAVQKDEGGRLQQTIHAGAAALALLAAVPAVAADFREVGRTVAEVVEIDLDSVRREEQAVLYRLRARPFAAERHNHYVGHVAVNCEKRTRSEVRRTVLSDEGWRSTATPQAPWRPVGAGSREARELALACRVAERGVAAAGPAPAAKPLTSATQAGADKRPAPAHQTTTGMLVSAQGHVLAPAEALDGCDEFRVVTLSGSWPGRRVATERLVGFVLLQAEGGPYQPLQARGGLLPKESALTVIGFAPQARPGTPPLVTVAYASGEPPGAAASAASSAPAAASAAPAAAPKPWITVASGMKLGAGPVLDDRGQVVGWLQHDGEGEDGQPRGLVMTAEPLRHVLDYHGIDWQGALPPIGRAVRRGAHGTVLVACSTTG